MRTLTLEAKVGFVVIAVIAAVFWSARQLTEDFGEEGILYSVDIDSAEGLAESGKVEIAGVQVGKIEKIEEVDGRAHVTFRVDRRKPLPHGTVVNSEWDNLLGDYKLAIRRPPPGDLPLYRDGDAIPEGPKKADIETVLARVDVIAQNMEAISTSMRNAIGTAEGEQRMVNMMENMAVFAENMAQVSSDNRESLNRIIANTEGMSERLAQVIDNSGREIDQTFAELHSATEKLDSSLASIDSVAGKIDRGEGTLGKLVNDDTTITSLNSAVGGVNQMLDRVNRTKVYVSYQGEMQAVRADGETGVMKNTLMARIQPKTDYGYLLGVSDDPGGNRERRTTVTIVDPDGAGPAPGQQSITETERFAEDYLFTAQFYKRWGIVTGRIGLKENSGGVGGDVWLLRDKLRLSADAWQFSREKEGRYGATVTENPRLKVQARYDLNKHFFVAGGVDDVISRYDRRALYVGAGFEFNDDDLKYVMGSIPGR